MTRWKGGLDFIAAIATLGRRDICCVLVGSEQRRGFRRELEAAIERNGLAGLFRIVEECRDMPAAYMLADVVVSASSDPEGFGRVIVEAQAMGRPVVATDHGGARETIVPGVTGWLVPPRDPAALAAAIGEALSLGGERAAAACPARDRARRGRYTREAMCAAHDRGLRRAAVSVIAKKLRQWFWQAQPAERLRNASAGLRSHRRQAGRHLICRVPAFAGKT